MPSRQETIVSALLVQNRCIFTFTLTLKNIFYSILYFFKSSQYRAKAWCNSWIILRAFDPRSYKKRIVILCTTILACFVSFMVILMAV